MLPAIIALALICLSAASAQSPLEDCVKAFDPNKDCFTYKSKVDVAKLFTVEYKNYYKIVTDNSPYGGNATYALVIRGAPAPSIPNVNATIEIPAKSVGVLDTTVVTMLEVLGELTAIVGANEPLITSPCYQKLYAENKTVTIDTTNTTSTTATLSNNTFNFGDGVVLNGLESKTVMQYATSDPSPLGRTEWIEFVAQFFNAEETGEIVTAQIRSRYNCVKDAAAKVSTSSPTVAWISYTLYNGVTSYSISSAAYKKAYVEDAGGKILTPSTSLYSDLNSLKDALKDVDVVIDESFLGTDTPDNFLKVFNFDDTLKFVKNKQVYRLDKRLSPSGSLDWYESAVVFSNVVLQDFVSIIKPSASSKSYVRRYVRNIYSEQKTTVTKDQCLNDPAKPLSIIGDSCDDIQKFSGSSNSPAPLSLAAVIAPVIAAVITVLV